MFWLAIWKTCSPRTTAIFFSSGTALIKAWTGTVAALYPTLVVLVAPLPAIVPPVARMTTLGKACPVVSSARAADCQIRRQIKKTKRIFMGIDPRLSFLVQRINTRGRSLPCQRWRERKNNRAGGIRTHGLYVPNVALYQAEPQPVMNGSTEVISRSERKQPLIS